MRLSFIAGLVFAHLAQPAFAKPPEMASLENELHMLVASLPSEYGIAAVDMRDGSTVTVNGDKPFPMASVVKIAVAAAYLSQVDHGRRSLDDIIGGRTAAKQLELMIVKSDNYSTDLLLANLGGPQAIQKWLKFHKLSGIRVDRNIARLLRERGHLNDWQDVSTPVAMTNLLIKLHGNDALTADSRAVLFELMSRVRTGTSRIRGLLPAGTRVEDKTGTLNGVTNDVGFITMPDGHRIAIAVFAKGGRDRVPGIAKTARRIYDRLVSRFTTSQMTAATQ